MFDEETVAEGQEESTPSTTEEEEESTEETDEEVADDEQQDDSTDSDDTEEEETDDSAEEDVTDGKPKKKNAVQKSIDRLTRQRTLAEQERDYWRQQALESKRQTQSQQTQQPEPTTLQEPKEEDFDDYKDYVKALVKFERQVEKVESQAQAEKESKAEAQRKAAESFTTNLDKMTKTGHEKYGEEFDDAMENAVFPKSMELRDLIASSPVAPEIAIFLNNNEEEALRLTKLSPLAFAREIGNLEAKFSKAPPTKKVTNAPKPINTIKGTGGTNAKSEDNMTTEEWIKHRESELARKNKGG